MAGQRSESFRVGKDRPPALNNWALVLGATVINAAEPRYRAVGAAKLPANSSILDRRQWHSPAMAPIDWDELRRAVRAKHGWDIDDESFSTEEARLALVELVGDDALRSGVDYCVDRSPAANFVQCIFRILRPEAAVERCLEIYRTDPDRERRHAALGTLIWAADRDILPIVDELLADADPIVQGLGASLLDEMLWAGLVHPHEAEPLLRKAEEHPNPRVQGTARTIDEYLRRRGVPRE